MLDILKQIIAVCVRLFGRDLVYGMIHEQIKADEEAVKDHKRVKTGMCLECGREPFVPKTELCAGCHQRYVTKEITAEFKALKSGDVSTH